MLRRKVLFFLFFSFSLNAVFACSCNPISFCDRLEYSGSDMVIFRGTITDKVVYDNSADAVFLEVNRVYRDNVGIGSLVKLYGGHDGNPTSCDMFLRDKFEIGEEVAVSLFARSADGINHGWAFTNSPGEPAGDWQFGAMQCNLQILRFNEEIVNGFIAPGVNAYPKELFDEAIENCNFDVKTAAETDCAYNDVSIYPNPSAPGVIQIFSDFRTTPYTEIEVYDPSGRYMETLKIENYFYYAETEMRKKGVWFLKIKCEAGFRTKRVVIL